MTADFGVIFDMDGVLIDSYQPHFVSWQETAAQYGLQLTEEQFRETFGQTSGSIIRQLWGDGCLSEEEMSDFDRIKEGRYRELVESDLPLMTGGRSWSKHWRPKKYRSPSDPPVPRKMFGWLSRNWGEIGCFGLL